MTKRKKSFDCVGMQHEAGRKVSEMLRAMTPEERAEHWRRGTQELRELQAKLREEGEKRAAPAER